MKTQTPITLLAGVAAIHVLAHTMARPLILDVFGHRLAFCFGFLLRRFSFSARFHFSFSRGLLIATTSGQ